MTSFQPSDLAFKVGRKIAYCKAIFPTFQPSNLLNKINIQCIFLQSMEHAISLRKAVGKVGRLEEFACGADFSLPTSVQRLEARFRRLEGDLAHGTP